MTAIPDLSPPLFYIAIAVAIVALFLFLLPPMRFAARSIGTILVFAKGHWFRPRLASPLGDSVLRYRAGFSDCDVNMHITNARYLELVDAGRFELLARMGFLRLLIGEGYRSLIGTTCIRFRREVPLFARFELRSRLLGWDEKWLFTEHHFELGGRAVVVVLSKFLVIDGERKKLAPSEALGLMMGSELPELRELPQPPDLPERVVRLLRESDGLMSPD